MTKNQLRCVTALLLMMYVVSATVAQTPKPALAFAVVSVRPAAPGAHTSGAIFWGDQKLPPPKGLLSMTSPTAGYIAFAYGLDDLATQIATTEKLPRWANFDMYTVVAWADIEPTWDQLREMMRTMLAERFGVKFHEEMRPSEVNELVLVKQGVLGPQIKLHPAGEICIRHDGTEGIPKQREEAKNPPCYASSMRPGKMYHIGALDTDMSSIGRFLGSIAYLMGGLPSRATIDRTGLTETYDLTLDFHVQYIDDDPVTGEDDGGPTFSGALEKQLGMKFVKGTGPVRTVVIDHITEPATN